MQLLKFEFLKLKYSRSFKTVLLLSIIIGLTSALLSSLLSEGQIIYGYIAFFQQFAELRTLIFVFAGVLSGLLIGEDFSSRAVQSEIASGHSRLCVVLSKTISYMVGVCMLIIIQVVIGTLVPTVIHGFGANINFVLLGNMLRAVLLFMFLTCTCSMIYVVTSFWFKKSRNNDCNQYVAFGYHRRLIPSRSDVKYFGHENL